MPHAFASERHFHSPRAGFSLVELSIVLVILGLLVGGVLVGQTLIHSAELRSQVEQIKKYQTGINTFRLRYDGLPGDIDNATRMFLPSEWPNITNGDGNEKISDADGDYVELSGEVLQFWMQLGASKMIEGSFTTAPTIGNGFPETAFGRNGLIAVYDETSLRDNVFYLGVGDAPDPGTDDSIIGKSSLTPEEAKYMDAKFDDGHPLFGTVRARNGATYNGDADYFDTLASLWNAHIPLYASALGNLFIAQAQAAEVTELKKACIIMDTLASTEASEEAAYYALSNISVTCELLVKME